MKSILIVGPVPPPFGGIASVIQTIVNSPLAKNYSFEVFDRGNIPQECSDPISRNIFRIRRFIKFFRELRQRHYDFVHIHVPFPDGFLGTIVFMIIARFAGTKILLHIHGTDWDTVYTKKSQLIKFVFRIGLLLPQQIVVLYETWRININKLFAKANVQTIPNCLEDIEPPNPVLAQEIRSQLGLDNDEFIVLTVGFVGLRKGYLDILDALPQVVKTNNSVRFVFVGGEEYRGESSPVMARIEKETLDRWVVITGEVPRSKIPAYFAIADVFLLPSRQEGMPISILEAMRARLPIITTAVGGIPEMIEDGQSGILIEPGNPVAIAQAVTNLLKNEKLRIKLSLGARTVFENKYEAHVCISQLSSIYNSM
ncbi:MAG: glycosyltransferase family 4 protein [Desulfomonilaceae bacterium]